MPFISWNHDIPTDSAWSERSPSEFQYLPPPACGGLSQVASFCEVPPSSIVRSIASSQLTHSSDEELFGIMCPALRALQGLRVRCRYDGGHDTGWANFESLECSDVTLTFAEVCERLVTTDLLNELREHGWLDCHPGFPRSESDLFQNVLMHGLAYAWVERLLRPGFGTGAFGLYGQCVVDLYQHTITDDPLAPAPTGPSIALNRQ